MPHNVMTVFGLSPWVALVVGLNLLIALAGFYLAWHLWQLRNTLADVADNILDWEKNTHAALDPAVTPPNILLGQQGIAALRQQYAQLQRQLQQAQRVLDLVGLGTRLLRRRRRSGAKRGVKSGPAGSSRGRRWVLTR